MRFERKGLLAIEGAALDADWETGKRDQPESLTSGIAYLTIRGPTTHHTEVDEDGNQLFESYDALLATFSDLFVPENKIVFVSGDGPGGDVSGCFDGARQLRSMVESWGGLLVWYVDGQTCSALLAWSMAADYIVVPPEGRFGSIGVIAQVDSFKKQAEAYGQNTRLITSGKRKADGHPLNEITEDVEAAIQSSVDYEANIFFQWVSERRGIPVETIRSWQAGIFHGQEAVDVGLADEVAGESAALAMVAGVELTDAPQGAESDNQMAAKSLAASARARLGLPEPKAGASSASSDIESIRKSLGKKSAEDSDEGRAARRALAALDEKEDKSEDEEPEKKDHEEPDGDEGSAESEDGASAAEDEDEGDDASSSAESEDTDAKRCEDDAKKAEAEAADEDAKARSALSSSAKDASKTALRHMNRAGALRNRAVELRGKAKMLNTIAAQSSVIVEQGKAIDTLTKRVAKLGAPNPSVAAIGAKGTRGREQTNGATAATGNTASGVEDVDLSIFSERELKALRLGTKSTGLVDVGNGKMELGLLSPEQANAIVAATEKRVAQLRGGE